MLNTSLVSRSPIQRSPSAPGRARAGVVPTVPLAQLARCLDRHQAPPSRSALERIRALALLVVSGLTSPYVRMSALMVDSLGTTIFFATERDADLVQWTRTRYPAGSERCGSAVA